MTKKDSEHEFQATIPISETLSNRVIQLRLRVLILRTYGGATLTLTQCHNSNCHISFPMFTFDNVNYSGPNISVQ